MTIAMCYLSPEGIVLGADSTSSAPVNPAPGLLGFHYFNFNQKLFELGSEAESATLGVLTWGMGGIDEKSYRTLFALLVDDLKKKPPKDVAEVATRWRDQFSQEYSKYKLVAECQSLAAKKAFDPNAATPATDARTKDEEERFIWLKWYLVVGFCIAGYWLPDRTPTAFEILFDPLAKTPPNPQQIPQNHYKFWGAPNMIRRLMFGWDEPLKQGILKSGKWTGTDADLTAVLETQKLAYMVLPIRDAIDFVHACVYSTIKALKFSNLFQICGGPIEIAVITSDRKFRWVRHKAWDAAITEE
jgi:hypothetical protein